tara:strand:+ start:425 stop:1903 length:1479 start_codon:yes stop_codon:yes gene_type:complete
MKHLIKKLLREGLETKTLTEDITSGRVTVYHRTGTRSKSPVKGIASDGYRHSSGRFGDGVYTTYTLESQLNGMERIYGNIIIESKVKSMKNFLIFDYGVARKIYGNKNYTLDKQLRIILGGKFDKYKYDDNLKNLIEEIPVVKYTSDVATNLVDKSEYNDIVANISGMVFTGPNDGNVLVCYDRKNVEPIRYTMDEGKTWKNILDKNIYKRIKGYDPEDKDNAKQARIQNIIDNNYWLGLTNDDIIYLLMDKYKNGGDFVTKIFTELNEKMLRNLLSSTPKEHKREMINQMFPFIKDKLDDNMITALVQKTPKEHTREIVNQIIPLVKDKLDGRIVGPLLHYTPKENKLEIVNQIFPLVKDKLDSDIGVKLLDATPKEHKLEMINQMFPLMKDKLDNDMLGNLLLYTPEEDRFDLVNEIFPLVKDNQWDYKIVWSLLQYTPEENRLKMINRIFPLVKDRLDEEFMTNALLEFTPKKHKEYLKGLINKAKGQS